LRGEVKAPLRERFLAKRSARGANCLSPKGEFLRPQRSECQNRRKAVLSRQNLFLMVSKQTAEKTKKGERSFFLFRFFPLFQ
jgi:hypothetical protein